VRARIIADEATVPEKVLKSEVCTGIIMQGLLRIRAVGASASTDNTAEGHCRKSALEFFG
jgi:hypothetical protein